MLKYIQDEEIKPVIQFSLYLSTKTVGFWRSLFEKEQYAVPNGFKENDVNLNAPWLFTDIFCLNYVNYMAKAGMLTYSDFLAMSTRKDICEHFTNCLTETAKLYNQSTEIALKKGILARHPYIEVPKETDYVDSKAYLSGLNPFNAKRSLNAVEIAHLYLNFTMNSIGMKLTIAFAQTSQSKEIQEFMIRGRDISKKHIQIFILI
jgi:hypothetical protein